MADVMAAIADRVVHDMGTPFTFPSTHHRILEPYDYYAFGQAGAFALSGRLKHVSYLQVTQK